MTLTSKNRNQSSSGMDSNGLGSKTPMLLMRISTAGYRWIARSAPGRVPRAAASPSAFDPILATAASTRVCVRPFTITLAPSFARVAAMANPIPAVDPVTSAFFPFNCKSIGSEMRAREQGCGLFLPQGTHWIDPAGAQGGKKTRQECGHDQDWNRQSERQGFSRAHSFDQILQQPRRRQRSSSAYTDANDDHAEALAQHQPKDIAPACAERHAYADFRHTATGQIR